MTLTIRPEAAADIPRIESLTIAAFRDAVTGNHNEQEIIAALRAAGALTRSLVAELDGRIVGHIALSPVTLSDNTPGWYGLGPLAVEPACQGQGIGSALVRAALEELHALDAAGCVLAGEPAFYSRFGFRPDPALHLDGVPAAYFLTLHLTRHHPAGAVSYHPAFSSCD